jgi:hypothetical protein
LYRSDGVSNKRIQRMAYALSNKEVARSTADAPDVRQNPRMNATPLEAPPISGTVEEVWFDARGDTTWVMFELDDGTSYVGVFGDGQVMKRRATGVAVLSDGRTAVVLARGRGYVLDVIDRQVVRVLDEDTWSSVCAVPTRGLAILAEFSTLVAVDRTGELWRSNQVARDGIILDDATPDVLTGKAWWEDGWYAFSLRFDGWILERGELLTTHWSAFRDPSA